MERELDRMPFDRAFQVDGSTELCHATGIEVCLGNPADPADWWVEYEDSEGGLHYGR